MVWDLTYLPIMIKIRKKCSDVKDDVFCDTSLCYHRKNPAVRNKQPFIIKKNTLISAAFNRWKTRWPSATFRPCSKLIWNNAIMRNDDLIWEWFSSFRRDWFDYQVKKNPIFQGGFDRHCGKTVSNSSSLTFLRENDQKWINEPGK